MSSIVQTVAKSIDGDEIKEISSELGVSEDQAKTAVSTALPLLVKALSKNAQEGDAENILNAVSKDHSGDLIESFGSSMGLGGLDLGSGAKILGHILGGKQSNVESGLSKMTGLDSSSIGKLLSILAPLVLSALAKQNPSDTGSLLGLLQGEEDTIAGKAPEVLGALNTMLDKDGDGSGLDEAAQMGAQLFGKLLG